MSVFTHLARTTIAGFALAAAGLVFAQHPCSDLTDVQLSQATVQSAAAAPQGTVSAVNPASAETVIVELPAHCAVRIVARPTRDSEIQVELWLPLRNWNGKYKQVGNGGWAGQIRTGALMEALRRGYAVAATDNGHSGPATGIQAWAAGHPEKLVDFGHRAVHLASVHAKSVVAAFYGSAPRYSYFEGCSEGGREGLMEAQRYADDFDGIVVGAPAHDWTGLFTSFVWNEQAMLADPAAHLTADALQTLQDAALQACDVADGVDDGLIENPLRCSFDAARVACDASEDAACLSEAQVAAVQKIYAGPRDANGMQLFPGLLPGAEARRNNWSAWLTPATGDAVQFVNGNSLFRDAVYEDPNWDYRTFEAAADLHFARARVGTILDAVNSDLRAFKARSGKLLHYHGWGEAAISPLSSVAYHGAVRDFMARFPDASGERAETIDDFYRLFMVPGMGHCTANPEDYEFGNNVFRVTSTAADRNVFSALERWVEEGIAPAQLIARRPDMDGSSITHPLCPWPQVARYDGIGDPRVASSFMCAAPE